MIEPLEDLGTRALAVALDEPLFAQLAQILLGRFVLGWLKGREAAPAEAEALVIRLDSLGDP